MKKLASSLMLAGLLATGASLATAAQIENTSALTFSGGSSDLGASFGPHTMGKSFLEKYTFDVNNPFTVSSAVISIALGKGSALNIDNLSLSGAGGSYAGVKSVVGNTQYYTINASNLAAGAYTLAVGGSVAGHAGGSFGGNLSVAAVPEASTLAMMLGGLALVGFAAYRRRKTPTTPPSMLPA